MGFHWLRVAGHRAALLTVSYLGEPDHGVILSSYLGSWMMAGAFLAIGGCMSALTKSQIIAFIVTGSVCLLLCLLDSLSA